MTLFSEKMPISTRCICGFISNMIKNLRRDLMDSTVVVIFFFNLSVSSNADIGKTGKSVVLPRCYRKERGCSSNAIVLVQRSCLSKIHLGSPVVLLDDFKKHSLMSNPSIPKYFVPDQKMISI